MSRKFKIRDQEAVHFVTFTIIHWLDIFIRVEYRDIFLDSIRYCQKYKGLEVYAVAFQELNEKSKQHSLSVLATT